MLAWCAQGCIGVDSVSPKRLLDMAPPALAALAALYLGTQAFALMGANSAEPWQARWTFADRWARHEARLKCLGLPLDEWSAELQAQVADCQAAVASPPLQAGASFEDPVIRIAWRS